MISVRFWVCGNAIKSPNDLNIGIEACVATLHHKDYENGRYLTEDNLGNTDDDESSTPFHRSGSPFLLEALDGWRNPIAYFDFRSYGESQDYQMGDGSDEPIQTVSSRVSEKTGVPANPDTYQLISAGVDQIFGTEDDMTNFDG